MEAVELLPQCGIYISKTLRFELSNVTDYQGFLLPVGGQLETVWIYVVVSFTHLLSKVKNHLVKSNLT